MAPVQELPAPGPMTPRPVADRPLAQAMLRGASMHCPACGRGGMFRAFLKVRDHCPACGEALHHHRADDAPAYFVMLIVGHVVVAAVMSVELAFRPPLWVHAAIWLPVSVGLALLLLPRVKGALVGLQWALRMHGFDAARDEDGPAAPGDDRPPGNAARPGAAAAG